MPFAGKDVLVQYSPDDIVAYVSIERVRSVSPSFLRDLEDKTVIGDDAHSVLALLRDANWSIDWQFEDVATQNAIRTALRAGTQFYLQILLDGTNGYKGPVKAADVSPDVAFDNIVMETMTFQGDGDWTIV